MKALVWSLAVACLIALGCGGGGAADDGTTPRSRRAKTAKAKQQADYSDENSIGMPDERVSRWRWDGARKDCFYVVGNRCFKTEAAACKAAGCRKVDGCDMDDSAPVQVSCPTAKNKPKKSRAETKPDPDDDDEDE
jgi:hypothetical protein